MPMQRPQSLQLTELELAYLVIALDELSDNMDLRLMESLQKKIFGALNNT